MGSIRSKRTVALKWCEKLIARLAVGQCIIIVLLVFVLQLKYCDIKLIVESGTNKGSAFIC